MQKELRFIPKQLVPDANTLGVFQMFFDYELYLVKIRLNLVCKVRKGVNEIFECKMNFVCQIRTDDFKGVTNAS